MLSWVLVGLVLEEKYRPINSGKKATISQKFVGSILMILFGCYIILLINIVS